MQPAARGTPAVPWRLICMAPRKLIIVTAPSGAGKTTIVQRLLTLLPQLRFSVSVTTRVPRPTEENGKDYRFVTVSEFRRMIRQGKLAEYQEVYPGTYYGTLRSELERASRQKPVLLDLDVKGADRLRKRYHKECLAIFIRPPSLEVLEERLRRRNTESEESLRVRLCRAQEEMCYSNTFDADIVNQNMESAVSTAVALVLDFLQE